MTEDLEIRSYLGVPILLHDGKMFGTLCVLRKEKSSFTSDEINTIQNMAMFLGYLIDLEYVTIHDSLTSSYNLNFTTKYFDDYIKGKICKWAMIFIDLDNFQYVNDTLGHKMGDILLQKVSERMVTELEGDIVSARLGGDDFVLLLSGENDKTKVESFLEAILELFSKPFQVEGRDVSITPTMGVSLYPQDGLDAETLLKHADMALQEAKKSGQNHYSFFNQKLNEHISKKVQLTNDLPKALSNRELVLHYQPQFNMEKKMTGIEALLRWNHPELGMISPLDFIPIAEETGAIVEIGKWVMETACQNVKELHQHGQSDIKVAVNLSVKQFQQKKIADEILTILEKVKLHPCYLELEITENMAITNMKRTTFSLEQIKALGVRIAIDDFGTGYSSLSYLKRFPLDVLKLDRSFIHDITVDQKQFAIVKAVIDMAHALELKVVAEGIEEESQFHLLKQMGCDEVQGYLLGKPTPFIRLLK